MKSIVQLLLLIFGLMVSCAVKASDVWQTGTHFVLPDGRLVGFGIHTDGTFRGDGSVQQVTQQKADGQWNDWQHFSPSEGFLQIDGALLPDNRFVVYGVGTNGPVWINRQMAADGHWHGWENLGGSFSFVRGQYLPDGCHSVLVVGAGRVFSNWQVKSNGLWGGWQVLGSKNHFNKISIILLSDGRLVCFGIGYGSSVSVVVQTAAKRAWGEWKDLGGPNFVSIHACKFSDGRLAIFGVSSEADVWMNTQIAVEGSWGDWKKLGSESGFTAIDAISFSDGRLACLAIHREKGISVNSQKIPNGNWAGWRSLGGTNYTAVNGVITPDGRLAVFAHGQRTEEWINRQTEDETWTGWTTLGGTLK